MQARGTFDLDAATRIMRDEIDFRSYGRNVLRNISVALEMRGYPWPKKPRLLRGAPGFYAMGRRWRMHLNRKVFKLLVGMMNIPAAVDAK